MQNWILYLLGVVAFLWVTIDVLTSQKRMSGAKKALWIILAFFFSIITAIVYYFVVKRK